MAAPEALVVVTLALLVMLAWTVWYCVGHTARQNTALLELLDDLQRELWTIRVTEDPQQAQAALHFEALRNAATARPMVPESWPDNESLNH